MKLLLFYICAFLGTAQVAAGQTDSHTPFDLPAIHGLPDLFTFDDGSAVNTAADWGRRRAELIKPLLYYQYGRMPPRPDEVTARVFAKAYEAEIRRLAKLRAARRDPD